VVVVDGAVLGDDAFGAEQVAGLRALLPERDTFARVPAASLGRLHMDPEGPTPLVGGHTMIGELTDEAVDAFLTAFGPSAQTTLLFAELRQLGGALGRRDPWGGAVPCLEGSHCAFFVAIAATPEIADMGARSVAAAVEAMGPWSNGRSFLNLAEGPVDTSTAFTVDTWARLCSVRAAVDPHGLFVANHAVPVADSAG
jgi:hypothetical protein